MRREEIIVTITPDGHASVTVKGVEGLRCKELTADLEQALGIVRRKQRTAEYYQARQILRCQSTGRSTRAPNRREFTIAIDVSPYRPTPHVGRLAHHSDRAKLHAVQMAHDSL